MKYLTGIFLALTVIMCSTFLALHVYKTYINKPVKYELDDTYQSVTGFSTGGNRPIKKFCFTDAQVNVKYNTDTLIISSKVFITGFKPKGFLEDNLVLVVIDKSGEEYYFRRVKDGVMFFTYKDNLTVFNRKNECFEIPDK